MKTVLVADDNSQVRRLVRTLLEVAVPCEVIEATDGQVALDLARAQHPAIAVLDLDMPALNGFEVCAELKADAATKDIVVFILTGSTAGEVEGYACASGADGFFEKPLGT